MNQSTAYQRYRIVARVRVEEGIGWWCPYAVVAIDRADMEKIANGFAEFLDVDGIEIDEFQSDGDAIVGECRSFKPLAGRAIYNDKQTSGPTETEYMVTRWPLSWIVKYEMKRNHWKYNRVLAKGQI